MIETVKIQGQGYLVNGSLSVPKVDGNRHYELVKEWLETNTPEPEFTAEELLAKEQVEFRSQRDELIKEADIEIYKLEDINADTTAWRVYRQALRDSTLTWVLPTKPVGV